MSTDVRDTIFIADLPDVQADETCSMRFWHAKLEGGKGMTRAIDVIPNMIEESVHADLRAIAEMEDLSPAHITSIIDDILSDITPEDTINVRKMEMLYRRLGWLAAFALYIEPDIRKDFTTIPWEGEMLLNRDPLFMLAHPDRLLRGKVTDEVIYREYVPMPKGLTHRPWLHSWHYNMRLHLGIAAAEETLKESVHFGQVMGLNRGYHSVLDARMRHPYVYAYRNKKNDEWATASGGDEWELFPLWQFPGGVVQWVQLCGKHVAEGQFPLSPAVVLKPDLLTSWLGHRLHREREIATFRTPCTVNPHLRKVYFPVNTAHCAPPSGEKCPYLDACWDKTVQAQPFQSGRYVLNPEVVGRLAEVVA